MVAFSAFISKLLSNYKTIWIDLHYSGICIKGDSCIPVNFGVDLTEWQMANPGLKCYLIAMCHLTHSSTSDRKKKIDV